MEPSKLRYDLFLVYVQVMNVREKLLILLRVSKVLQDEMRILLYKYMIHHTSCIFRSITMNVIVFLYSILKHKFNKI